MPRTARACSGGNTDHVLDRGIARAAFFRAPDDDAFRDMMAEAGLRVRIRILACCPTPRHLDSVLRHRGDADGSPESGSLDGSDASPGDPADRACGRD